MSGADLTAAPGPSGGLGRWTVAGGSVGYRAEIDGLRAVAVLPVILFHAGFEAFGGGFVGVDVFFVISGYLITGILLREIGEGRFSLIGFYERRARRILPALFTVMIACVPFAWLWMVPSQFKEFAQSLIWTSLFGSNLFFWQTSGYFELVAEEKPLLHTWSLAVEEQFYLFFPLFFLLALRFGRSLAFWSIVLIAVTGLMLSEVGSRWRPDMAFYLAPTRAWELLAGSLCAFALHRREMPRNGPLALLGLALILFAVFRFDLETRFPSVYTLVPVIGACLIILFAGRGTGVGALLSTRALVGIGLISYSAYLWHQPFFAFARIRLEGAPGVLVMTALAVASLALAYLSWRFVEQPFRRRRFPVLASRRTLFGAAALVSAAFIGFGYYGHAGDGLAGRFQLDGVQSAYLETAVPFPLREECTTEQAHYRSPEEACVYFTDRPDVAVIGDSHADELAYALAEELEPEGAGVLHLSRGGCSPLHWHVEGAPCREWTQEVLDYVIESEEIETVVLSYRMHVALFGNHAGVYPGLPDERSAEFRRRALGMFIAMVEAFDEAGKRVVVVLQNPELPRPIEELIMRHSASQERVRGVPRDWWDARSRYLRTRLDVPESVIVVDTTEIFCDEAYCYAGEDGVAHYFDDNHVSVAGARLVADKVMVAMAEAAARP